MKEKVFTLINKGMNRDLSISKVGDSCVYENHNIRITATDRDTMLSVTNERGTREVSLGNTISGNVVGYNVIDNHVVIFTHSEYLSQSTDRIYRIDYTNNQFIMVRGSYPSINATDYELNTPLFCGVLGFSNSTKIDSVVYAESDSIQKIYWVDGEHNMRFLNVTASLTEVQKLNTDPSWMDCGRYINYGLECSISKDNSGSERPNGTVQYLVTYYNKHGQETGYAWMSDISYLSPVETGGAKDGVNFNKITLEFSNVDTRFTNFRVYSIFRSSLDGQVVCYLVTDRKINANVTYYTVVDDGGNLSVEDADRLLYLGSQNVTAGTLAYKDQTLFLGDLSSVGKTSYDGLRLVIKQNMHNNPYGTTTAVQFVYSTDDEPLEDIPYPIDNDFYSYDSQLKLSSSKIQTFKGGELYRFAIKFKRRNGTDTEAFWIGDLVNPLYPYVNKTTGKIKRVVAQCTIPSQVLTYISENNLDFSCATLMIAQASSSDRLVKAQGIVNPTMFNIWERYNNRIFSMPSWLSRIRNANIPFKHFESTAKNTSSYAELQTSYWSADENKKAFYQLNTTTDDYKETFDGVDEFNYLMVAYEIWYWRDFSDVNYKCTTYAVELICDSIHADAARHYMIPSDWKTNSDWHDATIDGKNCREYKESNGYYTVRIYSKTQSACATMNHGTARNKLHTAIKKYLITTLGISDLFIVAYSQFREWCEMAYLATPMKTHRYFNGKKTGSFDSLIKAINGGDSSMTDAQKEARWYSASDASYSGNGESEPAYYKKHLMFVDENLVTLNSPELSLDALTLSDTGYKFRIVGAVKMTSTIEDYTVDANASHLPGADLEDFELSFRKDENNSAASLTSWPLWKELGLKYTGSSGVPVEKRVASDYEMTSDVVRYWLYMWQHSGNITEWSDGEDVSSNKLNSKIFANLHFGYNTLFLNDCVTVDNTEYKNIVTSTYSLESDNILTVQKYSEQYNIFKYIDSLGNSVNRQYIGSGRFQVSLPGTHKYPICMSELRPAMVGHVESDFSYLYSQSPATIEFMSDTHAMIKLHSEIVDNKFTDLILPYFFEKDKADVEKDIDDGDNITEPIIPWIESSNDIKKLIYITVDGSGDCPFFTRTEDNTFVYSIVANQTGSRAWIKSLEYGMSVAASDNVYIRISTLTDIYVTKLNNYILTGNLDDVTEEITLVIPGDDIIASSHRLALQDETVDVYVTKVDYVESADPQIVATTLKFKTLALIANTLSASSITNAGLLPYGVEQEHIEFESNSVSADILNDTDEYMLIGEIYKEASGNEYGGPSESAVLQNRFITAGPDYVISASDPIEPMVIYGNQGDTYFQRFDSLRIMPYGSNSENGVIDIVSAMLESHINLDGRTDKYRLFSEIASVDPSKFNTINNAYSQQNNYIVKRASDDSQDIYKSHITWTLEKKDMSDIDEWTHITLANSLKLDMDKGSCNALRRFNNRILAFQDKGISEILYNSRTQLSTTDGVPVELANSGKVDGKYYITNKYGCTDKSSIVEGKAGIYFVDNINKIFCSYNGQQIDNISSRLSFDVWFRDHTSTEIKAFYDGRFSDVYLVKDSSPEEPCLTFNETLGVFTSFFDYSSVGMMANIDDKFVSVKSNKLWLHNEGDYCKFYGVQKNFWVQYRVTPDPYGDKIWTNLEYRADFSRVLDNGSKSVPSEPSVDVNTGFAYKEDETFDHIRFWNEYQTTAMSGNCNPIKRFRTWRLAIPRAIADSAHNVDGLDRMRNPWLNILLRKTYTSGSDITNQDVMQLHDVTVHYYE